MFQTPPVDPVLGYGIHDLSNNLNFILRSLIQDHLGIPYVVQNTEDTANSLLEYFSGDSGLRSRNSRTIAKDKLKKESQNIIDELSAFLPKPKRLHNDDFYCRIVIPEQKNTVSVPHRDKYFHDITPGWSFSEDEVSIKMWFPILNISGRALGVIPGSHKQAEESYAEFYLDNGEKKFRSPHSQNELEAVHVNVGQCLLFPDLLVHGSLNSRSLDAIRISGELTLVYDKIALQCN